MLLHEKRRSKVTNERTKNSFLVSDSASTKLMEPFGAAVLVSLLVLLTAAYTHTKSEPAMRIKGILRVTSQ